MFGRLPCLSWLTFARNEPPKLLWMSVREYVPISANIIQFIHNIDIRWYTEEGKHQCQWWSHFQALLHCFEQLALSPRMSWQYVDCPGLTSRHTHPSIPQQFTQLQPSLYFYLIDSVCSAMLARPIRMHHPAAMLYQEASNPPAFASAFLASRESWMYSVTCEFSSQATHRTWCSTWTLAEATVAFGSSVFKSLQGHVWVLAQWYEWRLVVKT